jgi:hypothetical protein
MGKIPVIMVFESSDGISNYRFLKMFYSIEKFSTLNVN